MNLVCNADVLVLVCETTPYELVGTIKFLKAFDDKKAFALCPFVDEKNRDNIEGAFTTEFHRVLFSEYQPDFFDGKVNVISFKKIIQDYIAGA